MVVFRTTAGPSAMSTQICIIPTQRKPTLVAAETVEYENACCLFYHMCVHQTTSSVECYHCASEVVVAKVMLLLLCSILVV